MSTRTRIEVCRSRGRIVTSLSEAHLRAQRLPDADGRVRVALVATQALLLAGDAVDVDVLVGEGVDLEIVETTGTVAYDMRGGRATWDVVARVDDAATLLWEGLPFIVGHGANVARTSRVELAGSAAVAMRETFVLGRTGETAGRLDTGSSVLRCGRAELVDHLTLDDDARRDPAVLAGARCLDTVTVSGIRLDDPSALQWEATGSTARRFTQDAHASDLHPTFRSATARIYATTWSASSPGTFVLRVPQRR